MRGGGTGVLVLVVVLMLSSSLKGARGSPRDMAAHNEVGVQTFASTGSND